MPNNREAGTSPASGLADIEEPSASLGWPAGDRRRKPLGRWLKPLVTVALYVLIFYRLDLGALASRLGSTRLGYVTAGVVLYCCGQALSAYKWHLLLRPVRLAVPYSRILAFYFTGMFFNIFLPTIVGGDAVKAILLARETGAPARSTMTVFMERNVGLLALLTVATFAAWRMPSLDLFDVSLFILTLAIFAAFILVNLLLISRSPYGLADRIVALTPLARLHAPGASLYQAIIPYTRNLQALLVTFFLSLIFQAIVIVVVFLNTRALDQSFPMSAIAVFVPLISLAGMIPVSLNGLGVRDVLYLLLFGQLGASPDVSVSLALLYFAVTLIASLPGGVVYAWQRGPAHTFVSPPHGRS